MLPDDLKIRSVELGVADLDRSIRFYESILGLTTHARDDDGRASLGGPDSAFLHLVEDRALTPLPERAPGLFHVAIRVPDRPALARVLRSLARRRVPAGASDHGVSEALYLDDPDGNGLEVYCDRPRSAWAWHGDRVEMFTRPLDIPSLVAGTTDGPVDLPAGTDIGHVHLKVGDIAEALRFWSDRIGFEKVADVPGAAFVSAGRYHHHLGLNTWRSAGQPVPAVPTAGLRRFTVTSAAPGFADRLGPTRTARDPWGNEIAVAA